MLSYQEVSRVLAELGCERLGQACDEHGLWTVEGECFFTVPEMGAERECPVEMLAAIVSYVERSKETGD